MQLLVATFLRRVKSDEMLFITKNLDLVYLELVASHYYSVVVLLPDAESRIEFLVHVTVLSGRLRAWN